MIAVLALQLLLAGPIASGTATCETHDQPEAWFTTCTFQGNTWIDAFGDYEDGYFARSLDGEWQPQEEADSQLLFVDEVDGDIARVVKGTDTVFEIPTGLLPKAAHEGSWIRIRTSVVPR